MDKWQVFLEAVNIQASTFLGLILGLLAGHLWLSDHYVISSVLITAFLLADLIQKVRGLFTLSQPQLSWKLIAKDLFMNRTGPLLGIVGSFWVVWVWLNFSKWLATLGFCMMLISIIINGYSRFGRASSSKD